MDFSDCMKKVFLAGVGAAAPAGEAVFDIVGRVVGRGGTTVE